LGLQRSLEVFAGSGDAEHLLSQQSLDQEDGLNVLRAIPTLPARGPGWMEEVGELALPVP
jgi:hypothetical protein